MPGANEENVEEGGKEEEGGGNEENEEEEEETNRYVPGTYPCENCNMYKRWVYKNKNTKKYKNRYYDKVCIDCAQIVITSKEQQIRKNEKRKRANRNIKSNIQLSNESRQAWIRKKKRVCY